MIKAYTSKFFINKIKESWDEGRGIDLLQTNNVPIPDFYLNFLSPTFPSGITFSRPSSATYFNSSGVLTTAANDSPRLDYDPNTLALKGFLIEEARTNLILRSEEFDNASWIKNNASVTADSETAPDGTLTADKLVENTATGEHFLQQGLAGTGSTTYTFSVFAKPSGRNHFVLSLGEAVWDATSYANVRFNLLNSTTTVLAGSPTAAIQALPNGWFKCSITSTSISTATTLVPRIFLSTSSSTTYTGNGTSGMFFWGAQFEQGLSVSSYIKTQAASATRSADDARLSTITPWFNATEGTVYSDSEVTAITLAAKNSVTVARATSSSQKINLLHSIASNSRKQTNIIQLTTQATFNSATATLPAKIAIAYKLNDCQSAFDGVASVVDNAATMPTLLTTLYIGQSDALAGRLNGWIKRVNYYSRRLSESELVLVTS